MVRKGSEDLWRRKRDVVEKSYSVAMAEIAKLLG
jgi:hypothetical protein